MEDCCTAYWCTPCVVAQQNIDLKERARENYPMVIDVPYTKNEKMTYIQV